MTTTTTGTRVRFTVVLDIPGTGMFRVHRPGCRDLHREKGDPFDLDVTSQFDLAATLWGDVASDNYEFDTEEWADLVRRYADSDTRFLPCCKADWNALPAGSSDPLSR